MPEEWRRHVAARPRCAALSALAAAIPALETASDRLLRRRLDACLWRRMLEASQYPALRRQFDSEGFVVLRGVIDRAKLAELTASLRKTYADQVANGAMFRGGGNLSGHLNCFPGADSRFVADGLRDYGVFDFVQQLSSQPLRAPNVGCNMNLPGSSAQNEHQDGYADTPFMIVNVAAVDTDNVNGATELLVATHRLTAKYWQLVLQAPERQRPKLKQGDVVIRTSTLWHRGMPNLSNIPRPMLAFSWEDGGSKQADPYAAHDGKIAFLPNRFRTDWKGRMIEQAFVAAPRLGSAVHIARSFFS
jgi:ectoine hydroxylase-related dioxygenase (phytanoyl-CoA dioxygenase family)